MHKKPNVELTHPGLTHSLRQPKTSAVENFILDNVTIFNKWLRGKHMSSTVTQKTTR